MTAHGFHVAVRPIAPARARRAGAAVPIVVVLAAVVLISRVLWPVTGDPTDDRGHAGVVVPPVASQAPPHGTRSAQVLDPSCTQPRSWRVASIETWPGGLAQVWRVAQAQPADGPLDPAIPVVDVSAASVEAIGWCAPVDGPNRPPAGVEASLFRLTNGLALPVETSLRADVLSNADGQLWVPRSSGNRALSWSSGAYVIRIATAQGDWVRWLGIEVNAYGPTDPLPPKRPQRAPGSRWMS